MMRPLTGSVVLSTLHCRTPMSPKKTWISLVFSLQLWIRSTFLKPGKPAKSRAWRYERMSPLRTYSSRTPSPRLPFYKTAPRSLSNTRFSTLLWVLESLEWREDLGSVDIFIMKDERDTTSKGITKGWMVVVAIGSIASDRGERRGHRDRSIKNGGMVKMVSLTVLRCRNRNKMRRYPN